MLVVYDQFVEGDISFVLVSHKVFGLYGAYKACRSTFLRKFSGVAPSLGMWIRSTLMSKEKAEKSPGFEPETSW